MPDFPRRGSWLAALLAVVAISSVLAQGSAVDEIAKYRAALQDGNPAELWEARGEELWKQKRCLKLTDGVCSIRPTYSPMIRTSASRDCSMETRSSGSTAANSSASGSSPSVAHAQLAKSLRNSDVVKCFRKREWCR